MDGGAWWAKSRTQLSDFISTFHFHALEEEMATHSGVLAWRIPGTGDNAGNIRDAGSVPGLGRYPGESHSNSLQYSCLENPMDRGAWWATVHGVTEESDMT